MVGALECFIALQPAEVEDPALEALLRRGTLVRGYYQAIRRAFRLVHLYRAECCARRQVWREDGRIRACLEQVAIYRATIRVLRAGRTA
jgi:hypothetical protein